MKISDIKIFILVGGFGTRLKEMVNNVPKPMAPINNKPFLEYKIDMIQKYLPKNQIYLLTHHMSDIIEEFFKGKEYIHIIKEDSPLGTGGSIKNAIKVLGIKDEEKIMLMNGDTYIEPNYIDFIEKSTEDINMMTSSLNDCGRFNTLKIIDNRVIEFKNKDVNACHQIINIGCYIFNNVSFIKNIPEKSFSLEDKFNEHISLINIKSYIYKGRFIDIGTPNDYERLINEKKNETDQL